MNKEIGDIEKAALNLSTQQRVHLVRRLIAGLDSGKDQDVEQQWLDEAERRLLDYHSGKTTARPAEEIFSEIEQKLS
jgi:putative addiction module component (TIGR02574 family)